MVRAGLAAPVQGEPLLAGPTFAAPFHLRGDPADSPFTYGRYSNPTLEHFELALGELEGGSAVAFASGMAAISAVLLSLLEPGDLLVAPSDGYMSVRALAAEHLAPRGIETRLVPTAQLGADSVDGATLVWLETPANPLLDVCDIREVAAAAHDVGAIVAVDNTLATPLGQRPLDLGADLSVASDTKAMTGHGDLVMGHVAGDKALRVDRLRAWRNLTGALPGPFETWLAHRSLATLQVRLERQCATALLLATRLSEHPEVDFVRYPGLVGDPAYAVAASQMERFGPVLSFDLTSRSRAETFLDACSLVADATSFGAVHSTAERRARWGGDDVSEGLVRFSVGIEDPDDLLDDVGAALGTLS